MEVYLNSKYYYTGPLVAQ